MGNFWQKRHLILGYTIALSAAVIFAMIQFLQNHQLTVSLMISDLKIGQAVIGIDDLICLAPDIYPLWCPQVAAPVQKSDVALGKIVFRVKSEVVARPYDFVIMNGNGGDLYKIEGLTGSPALSGDGKLLASGCGDTPREVCVRDISTLADDRRIFPRKMISDEEGVKRIALPPACQSIVTRSSGLESISWSPDGKKLAVTCATYDLKKKTACVLALDGSYTCWEDAIGNKALQVVWSPTENVLAVGNSAFVENANIYLVGPDGKNPIYLTDGWNPEWSPDGKQLVFMRFGEDSTVEHPNYGLAVINQDGSNFRWLISPVSGEDAKDALKVIRFLDNPKSRSAWSPDGRYILFASGYLGMDHSVLFRYDLQTNETIIFYNLSYWVTEPECGR